MPGSMRILVSTPSLSYEDVVGNPILEAVFAEDIVRFEKSKTNTLDEFSQGLDGMSPKGMWGLNVPHFPLEKNKAKGVAGPGLPHEELFFPAELQAKLRPLCGKYDKWRPYPAEPPMSAYAMKMAKRFSNKRCRMFDYASRKLSWDLLFYVEHSPASLAHLDKVAAMRIAERVFEQISKTCREWPSVPLVLFSPYGIGGRGFSAGRNVMGKTPCTWDDVRRYANGNN